MPKNQPNSLKVVSGQFRGITLESPQSLDTHPMGSREKLALFNMLQPYLADATVLDAYAGTGALGIEALSLGAKSVIFVEKWPKAVQIIRQNLQKIAQNMPEIEAKTQVLVENCQNFAQNPDFQGYFSLILADPPYDGFQISEVLSLVSTLQPGGVLALSFPIAQGIPEIPGLKLLKSRQYAAAGIALYLKSMVK